MPVYFCTIIIKDIHSSIFIMNKLLLTISFIIFTFFAGFSQQIQKNFYQTFDIKDGVSTLKFDFPCKVEYKRTSNQRALIETFITWNTGNYLLLDYFIKEGEFNSAVTMSEMGMSFTQKKQLYGDIILKDGRVIKTTVSIVVFLPESFFLESDNFYSRCVNTNIIASNTKRELK